MRLLCCARLCERRVRFDWYRKNVFEGRIRHFDIVFSIFPNPFDVIPKLFDVIQNLFVMSDLADVLWDISNVVKNFFESCIKHLDIVSNFLSNSFVVSNLSDTMQTSLTLDSLLSLSGRISKNIRWFVFYWTNEVKLKWQFINTSPSPSLQNEGYA